MKKIPALMIFLMMFMTSTAVLAADEQAAPQSLGGQAGEAARELKGTAEESYATGMTKAGEAARKMEADARDAFATLQAQWNEFARQFQEKTQQIQRQLDQQWQDFNKSFNKPKQ
jgi:hypothetical protein